VVPDAQPAVRIDDTVWEIPPSARADMLVPARIPLGVIKG
jgi:hypothetical protein